MISALSFNFTSILKFILDGPPFMAMGKAEPCPSGYEITTKEDCELAMKKYSLDFGIYFKSRKAFASGSWNVMPYGCSYRAGGDNSFYFNERKAKNVRSFLSGMNKMICKRDIKSN